jgi:myo-inositol-1(or 4)-monophosphatase
MLDLKSAEQLVSEVGRRLLGALPSRPRVTTIQLAEDDGPHTALDGEVDHTITLALRARAPQDGIVSEESGTLAGTSGSVWYLDPIDGTTNLLRQRAEIAISLARYKGDTAQMGVVALPCRSITLGVDAQTRTRANGSPLPSLPQNGSLKDAFVGIPGDYQKYAHINLGRFIGIELLPNVGEARATGALGFDLAAIALGELDARFSFAVRPFDAAAGVFLIRSLGGEVTDLAGHPWTLGSPVLIAARSRCIREELMAVLQPLNKLFRQH